VRESKGACWLQAGGRKSQEKREGAWTTPIVLIKWFDWGRAGRGKERKRLGGEWPRKHRGINSKGGRISGTKSEK